MNNETSVDKAKVLKIHRSHVSVVLNKDGCKGWVSDCGKWKIITDGIKYEGTYIYTVGSTQEEKIDFFNNK